MPKIVSIIFNVILFIDFGVVHFLLEISNVSFAFFGVERRDVSDDINYLVTELRIEQLMYNLLEAFREYRLAALCFFEE